MLYWLQVSLVELSCWYPAVLLKFAAFDPLLVMVWPDWCHGFGGFFQSRFPVSIPRIPLPLIIFNLIGPSESFPSPKAPYSVLLSLTYLGGLGHLASHIWRTGDAWRTPGSSLKDAWIKSDGGPLLYERYWRTRRPRPTGRWACGPVRVCQGMSGSVRRVGFETFGGVWSFGRLVLDLSQILKVYLMVSL